MITIGLIYKWGPPHQGDKKYFSDLKKIKKFEDIQLQIVDWRYQPEEKDFFYAMPQSHIDYCANDFRAQEREKYLAALPREKAEVFKDYQSDQTIKNQLDQEVRANYRQKTGRDYDKDAVQYYTYTTGKSLDEAVNEYFEKNKFDALYLPGANFDPKADFCQSDRSNIPPDIRREEFERRLVKKAIEKGIPVLGVCSGSWMIASCFQGAKTKALVGEALKTHKEGPAEIVDETLIPYSRLPKHKLAIKPGTLLYGIVKDSENWEATPDGRGGVVKELQRKETSARENKKEESLDHHYLCISVNSTHWRAIIPQIPESQPIMLDLSKEEQGEDRYNFITGFPVDDNNQLIISGVDPKHLTVEAIETRHGVPVMGVQFHVESRIPMFITKNKITVDVGYPASRRIIESFVEAARTHANKTKVIDEIKHNFFVVKSGLKKTTAPDDNKPQPTLKPKR